MIKAVRLGQVRQIHMREHETGIYALTAQSSGEDNPTLLITQDALRSLWAHLTKILYPRAGDQLTERISTAKRVRGGIPAHVTYAMTAHYDASGHDIVLSGVARDHTWTMEISRTTGDDLWTSLEDALDAV